MSKAILRIGAVQGRYGLARSTIYLHIHKGLLPPPVSLGPRAVGFPENELNAIFSARIAGADEGEIKSIVSRLMESREVTHEFL